MKKAIIFVDLFLISLILLSIIGTQLVNFYENNSLLLILLPIIALIPVLVAFNIISEKCYSIAVISVALALLFHTSLISEYIWGADINQEYYYASLTKNNFYWNSGLSHEYNAMLSINMLAPIISLVTGIDLIWIFKFIFPSLFSLVPLILYQTFKKQLDSKTAFLSSFLLMSLFTFFTEINSIARQQIGEVLFALLMLLIVSKKEISPRIRSLFFVFFGFSLVTAHYSLAFIFIVALFFSSFFVFCGKRIYDHKFLNTLFSTKGVFNLVSFNQLSKEHKKINAIFIILLCTFAFSWYSWVANSAVLSRLATIVEEIVNGASQFFNPALPRGGVLIVRSTVSQIHDITKYLILLTQFSITIGVIQLLMKRKKEQLEQEYSILSLVFFLLSVFAVIVPYISSFLNATRFYQIVLLVLAPFSILGFIILIQFFSKIIRIFWKKDLFSKGLSLKIISLFLAVFLMFNSGFIYEIAGDHPNSIALSQNSIKRNGTLSEKIQLYNTIISIEEVKSAAWLQKHRSLVVKTYADYDCRNDLLLAFALIPREYSAVIYNSTKILDRNSYVYMRKLNIVEGIMGGKQPIDHTDMFNATAIRFKLFNDSNLIYSNMKTEIYLTLHFVWISE